ASPRRHPSKRRAALLSIREFFGMGAPVAGASRPVREIGSHRRAETSERRAPPLRSQAAETELSLKEWAEREGASSPRWAGCPRYGPLRPVVEVTAWRAASSRLFLITTLEPLARRLWPSVTTVSP